MPASRRRAVLLALTLTVQAAAASRMDPCGVDAAAAKVRAYTASVLPLPPCRAPWGWQAGVRSHVQNPK
jgi:hypothetical protein